MTAKEKKLWMYGAGGALALYLLLFRNSEFGGNGIDPTGNGAAQAGGATYSFNAKKVADDLWSMMREMGTDEDGILTTLTPINQQQFGQVVTSFGNKPYNRLTGNDYFLWGVTPTYYGLATILKEELSSSEYANLKRKYPNFL